MILIIDNYDSFTFNIVQAFGILNQRISVHRNDEITLNDIMRMNPEAIIVSPGPGRPEDAGISCSTIEQFAGKIPILGICLGHQAIGHVFGASITHARQPVHGKVSEISHDGSGIFNGLLNPFRATRYHSLVVSEKTVTSPIVITARTADGEVMGLRSLEMAIEGVQFHPESIATADGMTIFKNFLDIYVAN
ncbi:MAG: aminodeoxychorismate/anthranilate synthase component II [Desulfomonilaceae bacterium]